MGVKTKNAVDSGEPTALLSRGYGVIPPLLIHRIKLYRPEYVHNLRLLGLIVSNPDPLSSLFWPNWLHCFLKLAPYRLGYRLQGQFSVLPLKHSTTGLIRDVSREKEAIWNARTRWPIVMDSSVVQEVSK